MASDRGSLTTTAAPNPSSKIPVFRFLFETNDHIQRGMFGRNIKALVGRQMRRINGPDNARPNWSYSLN
ncbi:MAG TPA: hypothetical protein VFM62_01435 [Arthrobacter sp.]|nr:hypothetical protein [Arthrobacter sp.]